VGVVCRGSLAREASRYHIDGHVFQQLRLLQVSDVAEEESVIDVWELCPQELNIVGIL
jgi:hypothetical protein